MMVYRLAEQVNSDLEGAQASIPGDWVACIIDWNEKDSLRRSNEVFWGCVIDAELLLQGFITNSKFFHCIFTGIRASSMPLDVFGNRLENCWLKPGTNSDSLQEKPLSEIVVDLLSTTNRPETKVLESYVRSLKGSLFNLRLTFPLASHSNSSVAIFFWQEFFEIVESIRQSGDEIPTDFLLVSALGVTCHSAKAEALSWLEMLLNSDPPLFLRMLEIQAQALQDCEGTALAAASAFLIHFSFHESLVQKIDYPKLLNRLESLNAEEIEGIFQFIHRVFHFHFDNEEIQKSFSKIIGDYLESHLENHREFLISKTLNLALHFTWLGTTLTDSAYKLSKSANLSIQRQANLLLIESLMGSARQSIITSLDFELNWIKYYFLNHDPEITISEEELHKKLNSNFKSSLIDALKISWYVHFPSVTKSLLQLTASDDQEVSNNAFFAIALYCQSGDISISFDLKRIHQLLSLSAPVAVVAGLILAGRSGLPIEEIKELSYSLLLPSQDENIALQAASTFSQHADLSDIPALISLIQSSNNVLFRSLMRGLSQNPKRDLLGEQLSEELDLPYRLVFKGIYWNSWESEQFLDLLPTPVK